MTTDQEEIKLLRERYHDLNNEFIKACATLENVQKQIDKNTESNDLKNEALKAQIALINDSLKAQQAARAERDKLIKSAMRWSKPIISLLGSVIILCTFSKEKAYALLEYGLQYLINSPPPTP